MAPETWRLEKNTIQMDIYSMGIVFYELALLDYPYDIDSDRLESYKEAHMFHSVKKITELKTILGVDTASIILSMLEKSPRKRIKSWEEIEKKLNNIFINTNNDLGSIVGLAIEKKLDNDINIQKQEEEKNRAKKEKENYYNLVKNQFESIIVNYFESFSDEYNNRYVGNEKSIFKLMPASVYEPSELISYKFIIPNVTNIEIKCKVIIPDSFVRIRNDIYMHNKKEELYTPKYNDKNIMGWVEIKNEKGLGFNLLLVQSDDIYGDWYILKNKNNMIYFTRKEPKQEPFAFSINELEEALKGINATSLYSSEVELFDDKEFFKLIEKLI